ncbi:acyl-CoA dehydrogenase family protein [Streptomyces sp. NPDC007863]|uniref:acyl-CoA dehydrogenase family protein n=1 Tax=Streptomyces sp. NPDC007863 TaxID=3154894 RepID=UPI0033CAF9A9
MTASDHVLSYAEAREAALRAREVLAEHARATDREAAFPAEPVAALRAERLLSAAVPKEYGGHGLGPDELAALAAVLGGGCGSTAMVWAMHQLQLACLAGAAGTSPELVAYLREACAEQLLVASVTSEAGVGGSLRESRCALVPDGAELLLEKEATTVSYGGYADAFLVTARARPDAAPTDQVLVLVRADQARLTRTGEWDTLGMRGTSSPAHSLSARVPAAQVLPVPFGEIATRCMVPLSHLLWAGVWTGIAADAVRRAASFARARARAQLRSGTVVDDPRLGQAYASLRVLQDSVRQFGADYTRFTAEPDADTTAITVRANALKTSVSTGCLRVVEQTLEICGMAGYGESGPHSVARHLRDLHSARLMIANSRLDQSNSQLLLLGGSVIDA